MIGPLLKNMVKLAQSSEESIQCMNSYELFIRGESLDAKFLKDSLVLLRGLAAERVLSDKFTALPSNEKDVEQRVLNAVMGLCDFLSNPSGYSAIKVPKPPQQGDGLSGKPRRPEGALNE